MSNKNINAYSFYRYLISNGYYFDKKLIEDYLLSLKVKPFTILTGNSGTVKQNYPNYLLNILVLRLLIKIVKVKKSKKNMLMLREN